MAIISKQIGWSNESNLLYEILKQLNKLTSTIFGLKQAAAPKYKVYTAIITQSGAVAPIANVLENTIGTATWEYMATGAYRLTTAGLFNYDKTYIYAANIFGNQPQFNLFSSTEESAFPNSIQFNNWRDLNTTPVQIDGIDEAIIEIRVYN